MSVRNLTTMFRTNKRHYFNIVWWLKMSYYKPWNNGGNWFCYVGKVMGYLKIVSPCVREGRSTPCISAYFFFQIILESIKAFLTWPLITQYTAKHVFEACFPMAFPLFTPGTSKDSNSCILKHNKISVYMPKCTFKISLIKTGNYSI